MSTTTQKQQKAEADQIFRRRVDKGDGQTDNKVLMPARVSADLAEKVRWLADPQNEKNRKKISPIIEDALSFFFESLSPEYARALEEGVRKARTQADKASKGGDAPPSQSS